MLILLGVPACQRPAENNEQSPFGEKKQPDAVLAIDFDVSGSFANELDEAWQFLISTVEIFFRDRQGQGFNDLLVLAQISGTPESILFSDTPAEFRRKFKTAADFKRLFNGLDTTQSRVHSSLADTINHVTALKPGRSLVIGLTDLEDSEPGSMPKLQEALRRYGKGGKSGSIGIYWTNPNLKDAYATLLSVSVRHSVVMHRKEGKPLIPRFDD
jgi:hypothetical protein